MGVFILAGLVAVSWLLRLRRRSERIHDVEHLVVCGLVGALVIGVFGALLVRTTHAQPEATAIIVLVVLGALSLRPEGWHPHDLAVIGRPSIETPGPSTSPASVAFSPVEPQADQKTTAGLPSDTSRPDPGSSTRVASRTRRARSQQVLGGLGLVLFALGASLATVSSLKEWTPPPELSIATAPPELSIATAPPALSVVGGTTGRSVAEVQLGSAGPIAANLEVTRGGRRVWRSPLARTTAAQNVAIPTDLLHKGSRVLLVSGGHTLRAVDG